MTREFAVPVEINSEARANREKLLTLALVALHVANVPAGRDTSIGEVAAAIDWDLGHVPWAMDTLEELGVIRYSGFDPSRSAGLAQDAYGFLYDVWPAGHLV